MLLRIATCTNGEVQIALECLPNFDYARQPARWAFSDDGYGAAVANTDEVDFPVQLTTDLRLGFEGSSATARHLMKEGETVFCALSWSNHPAPRTVETPRRGCLGPAVTGATGSIAAAIPIMDGAIICSAVPSR